MNDLREGYGCVYLPFVLAQKYPTAERGWGRQYVFPSTRRSIDPRSGIERRHHAQEDSLQRALRQAVQGADIIKPATVHTLRHSFAGGISKLLIPFVLWSGFDPVSRGHRRLSDSGFADRLVSCN